MKIEKEFAKNVQLALGNLCETADGQNPGKNDIFTALGETSIYGVDYQIQLSLIQNKKIWIGEKEVRFSEITKIWEDSKDN